MKKTEKVHSAPLDRRPPELEKGFPVLKLPSKGEDLLEGRQYQLTALARITVQEVYCLSLPKIVECVFKTRPPMRYATHALNLLTGEAKWSVMELPAQEATFRAFFKHKNIELFTLDLVKLHELEANYKDSHKVRELEEYEARAEKSARKVETVDVLDIAKLFNITPKQ